MSNPTSAFLTATWSDLLLVTYEVPARVLKPRLAPGLELDTLDGKAFVSLVAFDFLETKVWGVKWPGLTNFPEINLRFYVKETLTGRRGVMFIKELVPSTLIAMVAQTIYNEPYAATSMGSRVTTQDKSVKLVHHRWRWKGHEHSLRVVSDLAPMLPAEDSPEHFFKEHQWGFGTTRSGEALVYEVKHPHWEVHEVLTHSVDVDFAQQYGDEFAFLNSASPYSTVHALGSDVSVFPHSDRSEV